MTLLATAVLALFVPSQLVVDPDGDFDFKRERLEHKHHKHHKRRKHHVQHKSQSLPQATSTALASWYYDYGTTASGIHYTYGFASLMFGSEWGRHVEFCYTRCVVGQLDDHGPYVSGRLFDLNQNLRNATGCPDLCEVRWRAL